MTHSITDAAKEPPESYYSILRGVDGVDETYDIMCKLTGNCVASLPFWEQDAETLSDALVLLNALNLLQHRGGYFFIERLAQSCDAIGDRYQSPEIVINL